MTFILKMNLNKSSLLGYTPEKQGNHLIMLKKCTLTITWLLYYVKRLLLTNFFFIKFFGVDLDMICILFMTKKKVRRDKRY